MKLIYILTALDSLLVLMGLGWIIWGPQSSIHLVAFKQTISPIYLGVLILLYGIYQGFHLRKVIEKRKEIQG